MMFPIFRYGSSYESSLLDSILGPDFLSNRSAQVSKEFPLEIIKGTDYCKVRAVIAGVPESNIQIKIEDKTLTISADIRDSKQLEENESLLMNEIQYGQYTRQVKFDFVIDDENVKAELKDGILELFLPKAQSKPIKEIKINKKEES